MGCCASVKVSPREYSTGTINKNSKLYERSKKGKPKTREHEQDQTSPRKKSRGEKVLTRKKEDFTAIDQHALLAPKEVKRSINTLADYLLKSAKLDSEKARVLFIWIANNIRYDTEAFFSGHYGSMDAKSVLKAGKAVCSGYANLFEALCTIAGLPVKVIAGFSKGYSYSAENPFTPLTKTDHAWNVVRVDGQWQFVECTWGAGYVDKNRKFQKSLNTFYFFTDPKLFITDHFPWQSNEGSVSKTWQLLGNPISLETYNKALKLDYSAMMWNVFPLTHKESIVEARDEVEIIIGDKDGLLCVITSDFYDMNTGMPCDNFTFLRQEKSKEFSISILPPSNGKYNLTIFGEINKTEKTYQSLMTYVIKFSNVSKEYNPYPQNNGQMWGINLEAFDNGFSKTEKNRLPVKIRSKDGHLDKTFVTNRNIPTLAKIIPATKRLSWNYEKYCLVSATHTSLNIKACFPVTDFYKLELMCQRVDGDDDLYHNMACFLIECIKPADPCPGYPKVYPQAQTYGCKLIEPLSAQLPANTTVTCRFQSPLIVKSMASDTKMTRDGDEWSCTVTTPSSGTRFDISGNTDGSHTFWTLFQYDVI
uniref:Transglutaminase-like domain-containing protein n=1 Tax=Magallana gigas TaxID=29159 RepID=A0A8W8N4J5_MAGGI|nr:kyphoscoliosis peptidase isoform X1 [Crassostrea gigas]